MKQETLKKSWRKLKSNGRNVEVIESDIVDDGLEDVSGCLSLENPMSQLNRKEIKEWVEADFDEPTEGILTSFRVLSTQQPPKTLTLMKMMWTRQTTPVGIK